MAEVALTIDDGIAAAEAAYRAAKRRLQWRRRLMPFAGVLGALAVWAALVYLIEVPPFIAPSPQAVAQTLIAKHELLLRNLLPTATEAVLGFLLGNLAAIAIATVFVHNKTMEEAFFPVVVLINTIPVLAKAPILVLLLGNGMEPKIAILPYPGQHGARA
jgi:NitT/TauT family transport system permease protein